MSMQGMSNRAEQWCPVKEEHGCILEVYCIAGFTDSEIIKILDIVF